MTFTVHLREEADNALQSLSKSDYDLCFAKLNALAENPYPGVVAEIKKNSMEEKISTESIYPEHSPQYIR